MSLSAYLQNKLLNHAFGGAAYPQPAAIYLALYSTDPTVNDVGTELSGSGYARVAINGTVTGNVFTMTANFEFPAATAAWAPIGWVGIRDALTGGNLLGSTPLSVARTLNPGDIFRESSLTVQLN
jgi:hypothetical protein